MSNSNSVDDLSNSSNTDSDGLLDEKTRLIISSVKRGAVLGSSLSGTIAGLSAGFILGVIVKAAGWL